MKYKVLFLIEMDESGKKILRDNDCEVIVSKYHDPEDHVKEIEELQPDALMCRTDKVTPAMMDASKNLKVVAKHGVGLDNIDMDYATKKGIQVVYAPLGNSNSVAEHALMLMLTCARRFNHVDTEFRSGNFNVRYTLHNTFELEGMTLGLLGCGRIGQILATKAANGLGMKVIGYDPYAKQENMKAPIELRATREEIFKEADFVSLHMPSTPETKHSIGMKEFSLMKPTATFINVARGDVIIESELIEALEKGVIMGAGLDVFEQEPIAENNPLLKMTQAVLTPHTAATTEQAVIRCCSTAAEGIAQALHGREITFPANRIDK